MKHSSELVVDADARIVVDALGDLSTYPEWNDLVSRAEPSEAHPGDPGPAWFTTLRAQVGPFSRSKQLRFVRDQPVDDLEDASASPLIPGSVHTIGFNRLEVDGRDHARWTMEATVQPVGLTSKITLTLTYDGGLWVPALGLVLTSAIDRATKRLPSYLQRHQGDPGQRDEAG